jgi:two-component system alkaline phosphatase synthesis response regulator PhoP
VLVSRIGKICESGSFTAVGSVTRALESTTVAFDWRDIAVFDESHFIFCALRSIRSPAGCDGRAELGVGFRGVRSERARAGRSVAQGGQTLDHTASAPKIVIADDNAQNVELLEAYLSDFDCEIRTAHDGEQTLEVVNQFAPDLLLLDVMMPRLSGFEVCKKLRSNPATKDLLILMVTALNEAADFERGVLAGTDDFLTKPVNKVELLCRIRSLLRVRHLKTQLDRTLAYLAEFESASRASTTDP